MNKPTHAYVEIIALLIMNAVPLLGVLFLNWQPVKVVMFYWLETLVMGVFTLLRMMAVWPIKELRFFQALMFCFIFCLNFGLFSTVHGFFILKFLSQDELLPEYSVEHILPNSLNLATQLDLLWPLCSVVVVQAFIMVRDLVMRTIDSQLDEMKKPYKRIAVQQVAILTCAFLSTVFPQTAFLLMLAMIAVKTGVDIYIWQQSKHRS